MFCVAFFHRLLQFQNINTMPLLITVIVIPALTCSSLCRFMLFCLFCVFKRGEDCCNAYSHPVTYPKASFLSLTIAKHPTLRL